jgi:hypothetical protein
MMVTLEASPKQIRNSVKNFRSSVFLHQLHSLWRDYQNLKCNNNNNNNNNNNAMKEEANGRCMHIRVIPLTFGSRWK